MAAVVATRASSRDVADHPRNQHGDSCDQWARTYERLPFNDRFVTVGHVGTTRGRGGVCASTGSTATATTGTHSMMPERTDCMGTFALPVFVNVKRELKV